MSARFHLLLFGFLLLVVAAMATTVVAQRQDGQIAKDSAIAEITALLDQAETSNNRDPAAAAAALDEANAMLPQVADEDEQDFLRGRTLVLEASNQMLFNELDQVESHLDEAVTLLERVAPGSRELGDAERSRAAYFLRTGSFEQALKAAQRAYDLLRENDAPKSQALTLQILGALYRLAGDHERALRYFNEATEIYDEDPLIRLAAQNNIGFTLTAMERYDEAIDAYGEARQIAAALGNSVFEARILTNIASSQLGAGRPDRAAVAARAAERLAQQPGGENWQPFVSGVQAQIAAANGDRERAAELLEQTFANRGLTETDAPYRDFHETAYETYAALGEDALALRHLQALKRLDDEAAEVTASAANALAAAEFDFANQELEIAQLRAGQLERDVQLAEQSASFNQQMVIVVFVSATIIVGLLLVAQRNIRRRRDEVKAANVELERTNVDLAKALDAKSEFLATTSHEIRTPLNGILGMTQIMLADRSLHDQVRERVELVHGAGSTMKAIVDDILDVAKLDSGKVRLKSEPFALADTIRAVTSVFADQAENKGVTFECDLADCPERAIGDEQRVRQIIFNLVSNAVKFTSEGRIRVVARPHVEDPDKLLLTVADTGIGIPSEHVEAIFAPFHQVDGSRTRQHSGTGLGLTISREFTVEMGGELQVESVVDDGSVFRLFLPLRLTEAAVQKAAEAPDEIHCGEVVVHATGALTAAIAKRALVERGPEPLISSEWEESLAHARAPACGAFYVIFGPEDSGDMISSLKILREERPELSIYAVGWPEDRSAERDDVCNGAIAELARIGTLVDNDRRSPDTPGKQAVAQAT